MIMLSVGLGSSCTSYRAGVEYDCFFILTLVQNVHRKLRKRLHTFFCIYTIRGAGWKESGNTYSMKQHQFSFVQAFIVAVGALFLSSCNGEKIDSDLIDSITGKVSVEKITIDQEDFEMTEGESTTLTATVLPADATDKTVSWHSSKEDVVMISNTGKVMAIAPGKSIITAKAGNKTDFITITVITNAVRVRGISLDKTTLELKVDDSETLTATVTPPDATNKNVSWTSSDATIATVENGQVKGVKPGSVTITAKTEDGGMTAECTVTVKTNLAPSVTIGSENVSAVSVVLKGKANLDSSAPSDLMVGFQYSLSEGILPSNSTTVEAMDADSQYNYSRGITGLEPETTYYFRSIVRMSGQDYYGETMSFTTKALSSMIHTEDASNVSAVSAVMNATYDLTDVQYTSKTIGIYYGTSAKSLSKTYVAEISSTSGEISENWLVLKPATEYFYQAYIKLDNKLYKEEIKSFTTNELSSMLETKDASDIAPTSAKMNAKLDLTDVQYTTKEYGFYWGTSKDSQTTYVKGGEPAGNAYSASLSGLSHKTQYWYKAYLKVDGQEFYGVAEVFTTDVVPVTGVSLDKDQYTFNTIGNTLTLTPTVSPTDATNKAVSWKSSNTSVATVDTNGKVTVVGNGAATVTVTTDDQGKTATCEITVAQWVTGITLDKTQYTFNAIGGTLTLIPTVLPSNALNKAVSWKSSNTSVATVDTNGKVTAVGNGAATVTVTTDNQGKTATCEITVAQWVTGITLDKSALVLAEGKSETVSVASITPENANDKSVSWSSDNTSVATVDQNGQVTAVSKGRATITAAAKDCSGVSVSCGVYVSPIGTVDMGFSNEGGKTVYWATSNLSESGLCARPEDNGDYYAWGETQPYYAEGHSQDKPCSSWRSRTNPAITGYNWSSYKWRNGTSNTLTKYNTDSRYGTVDNKTVLEADDDVAHVKLGGGWRMPTSAEWTELRNNCTWTWTTNYNGTGVAGRIVTSNKNGASIFLPAAGYRFDTDLLYVGSNSGYWSSSLYTGLPNNAYGVYFYSVGVNRRDYSRYGGLSVRPVSE